MKLIPDRDNVEIYKLAKFQLEIPKITKSDIRSSEQCKLSKRQNLSDFVIFVEPRI
jgi:hypothetical protein